MKVLQKNDSGDDDLLDIFTKLHLSKPNNQNGSDETNVEQELHKDPPKE